MLVENGEQSFLVEASPDIRLQSTRFRLKPIKDFLISHWHFDHMYGLHELLQYSEEVTHGLNIYCSKDTQAVLNDEEFSYIPSTLHELEPLQSFELADITVTPLPVYHMHAQDDAVPEDQLANTFGYLFEHEGKKVAYLADYYRVAGSVLEKVKGIDVAICEGTYLLTDSYKDHKPNHLHGQEIIDFAKNTGAKQIYYHSISHLTHKTHDEIQAMLPPNHLLAYDGLTVV